LGNALGGTIDMKFRQVHFMLNKLKNGKVLNFIAVLKKYVFDSMPKSLKLV
jgi:hypothetical protein